MTDARRLALLLPDFGGGGAERVALRLVEDWLAAGHEVDLVLLQAKGELLQLLPPGVHLVDLAAPRIRKGLLPLIRYFRERRPHAIQISMWPLTVIAIIARYLAGSRARMVTSDHILLSCHYRAGSAAFRLLKLTTRIFYPAAHSIVTVSRQAADDLSRLSHLSRQRIEVIYNPVSAPLPERSDTGGVELAWGNAAHRLITVGTLKGQKNHDVLIRSFRLVLLERDAALVILGDGPLKEDLEALAAQEGLSGRVIFPGFSIDPWPWYRSAHLFVLSSDYEGYPLVLIEAMLAGLPVVSTDCPSGPSEILDGGRYGRLVPVGDVADLARAIVETLDDPPPPNIVRDRAEALSGASTSERYLELMVGPGMTSAHGA